MAILGRMTMPRFEDVRNVPLTTDADLMERVEHLLDGAIRRQLWFMFLDERDRQSPMLIPIDDVPDRPDPASTTFGDLLRDVVDALEARSVVAILERPGTSKVTADDRAWARHLRGECAAAGIRLRGPILCHSDGLRWLVVPGQG
jgi:hypothetical protein